MEPVSVTSDAHPTSFLDNRGRDRKKVSHLRVSDFESLAESLTSGFHERITCEAEADSAQPVESPVTLTPSALFRLDVERFLSLASAARLLPCSWHLAPGVSASIPRRLYA